MSSGLSHFLIFFTDAATSEIYTLSLTRRSSDLPHQVGRGDWRSSATITPSVGLQCWRGDRKSTRLNSSHSQISYAVFCLKKKRKPHAAATPLQLLTLRASLTDHAVSAVVREIAV